jgi:SAM-dependent methyltransferase
MKNINEFKLYDILEEDHWWFMARRNILSILLDVIENKKDKTILEIGCGTGGNLKYLFNDFGFRIGLEYNDDAVQFAQNKLILNTDIIKGDANNMNLADEYVDCIALLDVLYHKNIINVNNVLFQAQNILKKDGYLLISDGAFNFLSGKHSQSVDSQRRFTKKELIVKLEKANFQIVRASYWGLSLFFALFLKRVVVEKLFAIVNSNIKLSKYDLKKTNFDNINNYILNIEKHIFKMINFPIGASIAIIAKKY